MNYGILWITGLLILFLAVFWPSDNTSPVGTQSMPETTSGTQQVASSPSSYRKITTRVLNVGTHVVHLKAGMRSETFTFAGGVKGSSTYFASKGCRMGYANGHQPVRACGSARGPLAPPGENLVSFAYEAEEDTQVVITVR